MSEFICPLLTTTNFFYGSNTYRLSKPSAIICFKEECAWWIEDKQKCAIAAMGCVKHGK